MDYQDRKLLTFLTDVAAKAVGMSFGEFDIEPNSFVSVEDSTFPAFKFKGPEDKSFLIKFLTSLSNT